MKIDPTAESERSDTVTTSHGINIVEIINQEANMQQNGSIDKNSGKIIDTPSVKIDEQYRDNHVVQNHVDKDKEPEQDRTETTNKRPERRRRHRSGSKVKHGKKLSSLTGCTETEHLDNVFWIASCITVVSWLTLIIVVYTTTDPKYLQYLPEEERLPLKLCVTIHFFTILSQVAKLVTSQMFSSTSAIEIRSTSVKKMKKRTDSSNISKTTSLSQYINKYLHFGTGSGLLVAGMTVQLVSLCTNIMLACLPTVVMVDPIIKSRVFLIRWCEWIPLSGFMTFLSESLEINFDRNKKDNDPTAFWTVVMWSLSQTASCIPGIVFPFCTDIVIWNLWMIFSMLTYFCIFSRVYTRRELYHELLAESLQTENLLYHNGSQQLHNSVLKQQIDNAMMLLPSLQRQKESLSATGLAKGNAGQKPLISSNGTEATNGPEGEQISLLKESTPSLDSTNGTLVPKHQGDNSFANGAISTLLLRQEKIERRKFSYYLLATCSFVWTVLVTLYFVNAGVHQYEPARRLMAHFIEPKIFAMVCDASFDVLAKVIYMKLIIDVYLKVFDPSIKIHRQLDELRRLVSAIWESSSDVIAISMEVPATAKRDDKHRSDNDYKCTNEHQRVVVGMVSPSFAKVIGGANVESSANEHDNDGNSTTSELADIASTSSSNSKIYAPTSALMIEICFDFSSTLSLDVPDQSRWKVLSAYNVSSKSFTIPHIFDSESMNPDTASSMNTKIADIDSHTVFEAARIFAKAWDVLDHDADETDIFDAGWWNNIHEVEADELPFSRKKTKVVIDQRHCQIDAISGVNSIASSIKNEWTLKDHVLTNNDGKKVTCEMKVSKHAGNSLVAIVRDVTERDRRFEAERKAHAETLARQRDVQAANRFTRHEVKNGLLAGIELCDSMRTSLDHLKVSLLNELRHPAGDAALAIISRSHEKEELDATLTREGQLLPEIRVEALTERLDKILQESLARHIAHLDKTLQEVLETTLTEAMSREVVHGAYVARMERANITEIIERSGYLSERSRFPVHYSRRDKIPELLIDTQLVTFIHRNAISNACKYGKTGGIVQTNITYDNENSILNIIVANEPGPGHKELLDLGETASDAVFQQGVRLQAHQRVKYSANFSAERASAGDGAWIMQKCAMTLGGTCSINFLPDKTVFTFRCPATSSARDVGPSYLDFRVPPNTWGIAVDDSGIQRKMMDRIMANVGIEDNHRIVLGEKPSDVQDFKSSVKTILADVGIQNETVRLLILMDENLDYASDGDHPVMISGSFVLKEVLSELSFHQEAKVLALVRSANDSAEEINWYSDRCHGFFPKATMQRDRVREILGPLWVRRFGPDI